MYSETCNSALATFVTLFYARRKKQKFSYKTFKFILYNNINSRQLLSEKCEEIYKSINESYKYFLGYFDGRASSFDIVYI